MAGKITPVGVQQVDGKVQGSFDLVRENRPTVRFGLIIPPDATQAQIGQLLLAKCQQVASQEPPASLVTINQMIDAGQSFTIPDVQPAPKPPADQENAG